MGVTGLFDPAIYAETSMIIITGGGNIYNPRYNPTTQPRKHIAKCVHCGISSMIPDSTDKIMALICPQCGSPLDA